MKYRVILIGNIVRFFSILRSFYIYLYVMQF